MCWVHVRGAWPRSCHGASRRAVSAAAFSAVCEQTKARERPPGPRSTARPVRRSVGRMSLDTALDDGPARVRRFFNEQLPRVVLSRRDLFDRSQGTVSVLVEGAGAWTITFGDHASPQAVQARETLEADLILVWPVAGFLRLLDADTSEPAAIRPVALGDAKLLNRLGSLLLPPAQGGLGARLWGT